MREKEKQSCYFSACSLRPETGLRGCWGEHGSDSEHLQPGARARLGDRQPVPGDPPPRFALPRAQGTRQDPGPALTGRRSGLFAGRGHAVLLKEEAQALTIDWLMLAAQPANHRAATIIIIRDGQDA